MNNSIRYSQTYEDEAIKLAEPIQYPLSPYPSACSADDEARSSKKDLRRKILILADQSGELQNVKNRGVFFEKPEVRCTPINQHYSANVLNSRYY